MSGSDKWDSRWMALARLYASFSEDPSTQVGCVLVRGSVVLSAGWNGLPRGVKSSPYRVQERPSKYLFMEHAERNAIYNAARVGQSVLGAECFLSAWYPCASCARALVQAGISILNVPADGDQPAGEQYAQEFAAAEEILREGNVMVYRVETEDVGKTSGEIQASSQHDDPTQERVPFREPFRMF